MEIDFEIIVMWGVGIFVALFLIVCMLVLQPFPLFNYGQGSTYGQMTTVEDGIFFNSVWIRADYASSNTDSYCIDKGSALENKIKQAIKDESRVEMIYQKSIFGMCREFISDIIIIGD